MGAATEGSGAGNRITQPWGARRPYGPEDAWPVRVDTFLDGGVGEAQVDRWVQSACVLCSNGCGLDIAVAGWPHGGGPWTCRGPGRPRPARAQGTVRVAGQPGRRPATRPLVREGGALVESDWDTAMERIVRRSRQQLDTLGPGSIGFYTSGQLFLEEYYTWP